MVKYYQQWNTRFQNTRKRINFQLEQFGTGYVKTDATGRTTYHQEK